MSTSKMQIIELKPEDAEKYFEEFYGDSSLTFVGVIPEEAHLYRDWFLQFTKIDKTKPCYLYTGKMMNDYYGLTGKNAYPTDLHIITFKLNTFKEVGKICVPRFQIGGRWFDDIVDNNRRHQEG
jgi:hypothetical protein